MGGRSAGDVLARAGLEGMTVADRRRRWRASRSMAALASITLLAGPALAGSPASATAPDDQPVAGRATVEPKVLAELSSGATSTFWVYLREQADLRAAAGIPDRADQGRYVYAQLGRTAAASQARLVELLDAEGAEYETFWIANTVRLTGDEQLLARITELPEVAQVTADRTYRIPEPSPAGAESRVNAVEWNIDRIGAAQVWDTFGVTGEDIVVGTIDSGVQLDHPALVAQYRGNLGGEFDHNYHWYDPTNICRPAGIPCDNQGHGTHVTGTMVGDDGGDNRIGVAPGAKWIAAKGCETNFCSQGALLSAGQFMLAPTDVNGGNAQPELRPHIVNNSWGGEADDDPWYRPTVAAWVAAGIFPQFASGNPGPACGQAGNPGNLPEAYAAGAFDIDGNLYANSGRGPSAWGADVIKPNIAAPGVAVRSAWNDGGYHTITGTSMASPHVAGTVALMWSAAPELRRDIDATRDLLDRSAADTEDLACGGTPENNNVWGHGKLDAFVAVRESPRAPTGVLTGTVIGTDTNAPVAGATITITGAVDRQRTTGPDGTYSATLPVGPYDVAASAFAYQPQTAPVSIAADETTIQDFRLAAPDGPGLTIVPDLLEFGVVAVGDTVGPSSLTVTSIGAEPVTISDIPEPDAGFAIAGGTCGTPPVTLPRLDSCTLDVTFGPTASGRTETALTLTSNASGSPHQVPLRGTATTALGGEITLSTDKRRVRGVQAVDLSWDVTTRSDIDVFRDRELIATVPNTGLHTDTIGLRGPGSYTYEVCETGTSNCSNKATARFGGPVPSGLMTYTHEGTGSGTLDGEPFEHTEFVITAVAGTDDVEEFLPFATYVQHLSASITIDGVGTFDFVSPTITGVEHLGQFGAPSVLFGTPDGTGGGAGVGLFWGPLDGAFGPWDLRTPLGPINGEGFHIAWRFMPLETTGGDLVIDDCIPPTCLTAAAFTAVEPRGRP